MPPPAETAPAPILRIQGLAKTYAGGHTALRGIDLDIARGEILALLGPNGAGKTTLISIVCGLVNASAGTVTVDGHDHVTAYREARALIGLVPQEINLEPFETVANTVLFTRGLFGARRDDAHVEGLLKRLSLWDKRDAKLQALSGGMKRRVLIAKALSHGPRILFLDEPTAGVDVELRKDMWRIVADLRSEGVTIILTTHYIEEAEAIADRVGVISDGVLLLVEEKAALMARMGRREMRVTLHEPLQAIPADLAPYDLTLSEGGTVLTYAYDAKGSHAYDAKGARTGITPLLGALGASGLRLADVATRQSSLEDIFVELVHRGETRQIRETQAA